MSDCLFCKIAANTIPVTRTYETDEVLAFPDINPQAPVHLLIIPKQHSRLARPYLAGRRHLCSGICSQQPRLVAEQQGLANGYRVVINTGNDGGQTVSHLHLHLLGKRHMGWPPG